MKLYYYLYYKIYCGLRNLGKWELAESAMSALSALIGINVLVFFFVTELFPLKGLSESDNKIVIPAIISIPVLIVNYSLFLRKKNT